MLALALMLSLAAVPASITLELGESVTLDVGGVQRLAVSVGCYEVRPVGGGKLMIVGAELGESTVIGWRGDGSRFSFRVRVVPATVRRRDVAVPVRRTEFPGGRDGGGDLTVFEVPVELRTITQTLETDGDVVVLGTVAHGERLHFGWPPSTPGTDGDVVVLGTGAHGERLRFGWSPSTPEIDGDVVRLRESAHGERLRLGVAPSTLEADGVVALRTCAHGQRPRSDVRSR